MTNLIQTLISPRGCTPGQEVDFWYKVHKAMWTICDQLDDDSGVPLATYESNVFTGVLGKIIVEDSQGNRIGAQLSPLTFHSVSPRGITPAARLNLIYNFFEAFETLCEQLDADVLTDSDYESLCYTAIFLQMVRDPLGQTDLGNGTTFYWGPTADNPKQLVELFYMILNGIKTLTEKLDADGTVNDTDYEANAYTAICTIKVENGAGNVLGN